MGTETEYYKTKRNVTYNMGIEEWDYGQSEVDLSSAVTDQYTIAGFADAAYWLKTANVGGIKVWGTGGADDGSNWKQG